MFRPIKVRFSSSFLCIVQVVRLSQSHVTNPIHCRLKLISCLSIRRAEILVAHAHSGPGRTIGHVT